VWSTAPGFDFGPFGPKNITSPGCRLAADDSPPYRAFLDPKSYRRKETVHLVAIARALDGTTAVSAVVPTIVRR
jgi:hypothetical protein